MAEELQQLLEKIQHDGVEKANAESAAIVAQAKADAAAIVKEATDRAAALRAQAEADARAYAERADKTIKQAARDTILEVKGALVRTFDKVLAQDVKAALADAAAVAATALEAIKALNAPAADVAVSARLADTLKAQLAAAAVSGVTVVMDETVGSGFAIRLDGGRVEHDFSEAAIAAAIAKRLRPDLAKLVNG
ncbi:MAG: hypothetical protein ACI4Q3_09830 [Kiritimatiellia bacterium]